MRVKDRVQEPPKRKEEATRDSSLPAGAEVSDGEDGIIAPLPRKPRPAATAAAAKTKSGEPELLIRKPTAPRSQVDDDQRRFSDGDLPMLDVQPPSPQHEIQTFHDPEPAHPVIQAPITERPPSTKVASMPSRARANIASAGPTRLVPPPSHRSSSPRLPEATDLVTPVETSLPHEAAIKEGKVLKHPNIIDRLAEPPGIPRPPSQESSQRQKPEQSHTHPRPREKTQVEPGYPTPPSAQRPRSFEGRQTDFEDELDAVEAAADSSSELKRHDIHLRQKEATDRITIDEDDPIGSYSDDNPFVEPDEPFQLSNGRHDQSRKRSAPQQWNLTDEEPVRFLVPRPPADDALQKKGPVGGFAARDDKEDDDDADAELAQAFKSAKRAAGDSKDFQRRMAQALALLAEDDGSGMGAVQRDHEYEAAEVLGQQTDDDDAMQLDEVRALSYSSCLLKISCSGSHSPEATVYGVKLLPGCSMTSTARARIGSLRRGGSR